VKKAEADPHKCRDCVHDAKMGIISRSSVRGRGYGVDNRYCKQHAKKAEKQSND